MDDNFSQKVKDVIGYSKEIENLKHEAYYKIAFK